MCYWDRLEIYLIYANVFQFPIQIVLQKQVIQTTRNNVMYYFELKNIYNLLKSQNELLILYKD